MHESSYRKMSLFAETLPKEILKIADIGSMDTQCGSYRNLFTKEGWHYIGFDARPGPNVDIVLDSEDSWTNVADGSFDVVISGQTLEHTKHPWLFMREVARIVRPGGQVCIIAPFSWQYHPSPLDCWRIYPDGMRAVMEYSGLKVINVYMEDTDTVGIAMRPGISQK